MADDGAILPVLRVQQEIPTLENHRHETGDRLHQDRAAVPHVQLHHRGRHLQKRIEDVHRVQVMMSGNDVALQVIYYTL